MLIIQIKAALQAFIFLRNDFISDKSDANAKKLTNCQNAGNIVIQMASSNGNATI